MSNTKCFDISQSSKLAEYLKKFDTSSIGKINQPNQMNNRLIVNNKDKKRKLVLVEHGFKSEKFVKRNQDQKIDRSQNNANKLAEENRSDKLRNSCMEKLLHSQFRNINQYLYENPTVQAIRYMTPDLFKKYHESYSQLVEKWPIKPLDVIIKEIEKLKAFNRRQLTISDLGCGEAKLAKYFNENKSKTVVHSFDLVDFNEFITKASIDNVPLEDNSCDLIVYCLSLMATNIRECIIEGNRILKKNGLMYIAEVTSRFEENSFKKFISSIEQFGFKLKNHRNLQPDNYFVLFKFKKLAPIEKIKGLPGINLKPCKYKTR